MQNFKFILEMSIFKLQNRGIYSFRHQHIIERLCASYYRFVKNTLTYESLLKMGSSKNMILVLRQAHPTQL